MSKKYNSFKICTFVENKMNLLTAYAYVKEKIGKYNEIVHFFALVQLINQSHVLMFITPVRCSIIINKYTILYFYL